MFNASPINLYSLSDLKEKSKELSGQRVLVKGFLYHNGEKWILADEPNLRQCCIKKCENQIEVEGNFAKPSPGIAIQVMGLLQEGVCLKEAVIRDQRVFPYWTSSCLLLTLLFFIFMKFRKWLRNRPLPLP